MLSISPRTLKALKPLVLMTVAIMTASLASTANAASPRPVAGSAKTVEPRAPAVPPTAQKSTKPKSKGASWHGPTTLEVVTPYWAAPSEAEVVSATTRADASAKAALEAAYTAIMNPSPANKSAALAAANAAKSDAASLRTLLQGKWECQRKWGDPDGGWSDYNVCVPMIPTMPAHVYPVAPPRYQPRSIYDSSPALRAAQDARLAAAAKLAYDQSPSATTYFAMIDAAAVAAKSADALAKPTGAAKQAADDAAAADAAMSAYHANPTAANEAAALKAVDIAKKSAALAFDLAHPSVEMPGKDGNPTTFPRITYAYVYPDGTLTNLPYNPNLTYSWPCGITSNVPYEYSGFSGGTESCPSDQALPDQSYPWGWRGIDYGFHFGN
ncbi:MAG: hypothetical protein QOE87_2679 [Gaiellales bacterium]|nr:hypothetical protein [Gaiellales bacterium]